MCLSTPLSPNPTVCPWCNAAMGGAKLIIAKHVACHVTKHSPNSRKENMLYLLTSVRKGYCCILLLQIRPEGKKFSSQISFCAYTRRGLQMYRWRDVIACNSAPILPNRNLFSQNQHEIASIGNQIVLVGRPKLLSQSLPSFRYRFCCFQESLNVSEQNCNVYWSKVWIQLTQILVCAIYSTAVPLNVFAGLLSVKVVVVVVVVAVSSLARILGECSTIHSPPALLFSFFFFKVDISSHPLIPLFTLGSVHSGSASWDDCGRVFPDELRESSFP